MLRELNPKQAQLRKKLIKNPELIPVFIELLEQKVEQELQKLIDRREATSNYMKPTSYKTEFEQDLDRQIQDYHTLQETLEQYNRRN